MDEAARDAIVALDKRHVWHPYTAMDAYEASDPIVVARAKGAWLEDANGRRYLDGNASWWVASLGHGHPRLRAVLARQAEELVHCSLGGIAHEPAARLAAELVAVAPAGLTRVFYTDNGSTSIEVAVKMALQAWRQRGAEKKTRFVALDGAFHGDTLAATSLGGIDVFTRGVAGARFDCVRAPFPDGDGYARAFEAIRALVTRDADRIAAIFVEPLLQGASGMRVYAADYLRELRALATRHDVLLAFDEVFTGYGRTGTMWAAERAGVAPDLMCLGKTFAALLPMGATLATEEVFDAFRGDRSRALYYGHTFCGHPLGAALAREVLAIYREERIVERTAPKVARIARAMHELAGDAGVLRTRAIGMVGAADLASFAARSGAKRAETDGAQVSPSTNYLGALGWRVYEEAKRRGAYVRPLGDTVYVCPPLTIEDDELDLLLEILRESVQVAHF
jgi:adenosylmethionine-8-amino-7-oxononanoate aminotransferase